MGRECNPLSRTGWKAHQILFFVIGVRVLGCIANPLQQCGLASIGLTDDKNTKVTGFPMNIEGVGMSALALAMISISG